MIDAGIAWLKIIHIAGLSIWVAALFYLPSLLASHAEKEKLREFHRHRAITRITYLGVASPAAIVTIVSGSALIYFADAHGGWLVLKIGLVSLMTLFHVFCGSLLVRMRRQEEAGRPMLMASLVSAPAILVPGVLYLVLAKPI